MDNIAHTLVGAALGRTVADRRAPYPALVGAFAANLPDIIERIIGPAGRRFDYLTMDDDDHYLLFRPCFNAPSPASTPGSTLRSSGRTTSSANGKPEYSRRSFGNVSAG